MDRSKRTGIRIEPFKHWWKVSWTENEGLWELLFRSENAAKLYAEALKSDVSEGELREMERRRLAREEGGQ